MINRITTNMSDSYCLSVSQKSHTCHITSCLATRVEVRWVRRPESGFDKHRVSLDPAALYCVFIYVCIYIISNSICHSLRLSYCNKGYLLACLLACTVSCSVLSLKNEKLASRCCMNVRQQHLSQNDRIVPLMLTPGWADACATQYDYSLL